MKPDFRKTMIWLHTYSGLLLGWLLFAIFVTGTLSYFSNEINHWMKHPGGAPASSHRAMDAAYQQLKTKAPNAGQWQIAPAHDRRPVMTIGWRDTERHRLALRADGSELQPEVATRGGDFFVSFHYALQLRNYGGRYLSGLAALAMLLAVFSGIFTHRRFFKDFFTLRKQNLQRFTTDFHAISGVITLPFCLMIGLSALVIYINLYVPWLADSHFDKGYRQMSQAVSAQLPRLPKADADSPRVEPIASLAPILDDVRQRWPATIVIDSIRLDQPHAQQGRIVVQGIDQQRLTNQRQHLVYSSQTGEPLPGLPDEGIARQIRRVLYGLHEGHFADRDLRWLFFIQGLFASALIATGLILWLDKRQAKQAGNATGQRIVRILNGGAIGGLPFAVGCYLLANQWLPPELADRTDWQVNLFLLSWAGMLSLFLLLSEKRAWRTTLALTGSCFALIAIGDLPGLWSAILLDDGIYQAVALAWWLCTLTAAGCYCALTKRWRTTP